MGTTGNSLKQGKNNLGSKRNHRRKLGLLGLHAATGKAVGPCPSSEEIALCVEQKIAGQTENRDVLNHIADCDSCYEEWLVLSQQFDSQQQKGGKLSLFLSNPRYLTAIGTGLAAAASIAVFLSISTDLEMESRIAKDELAVSRVEQVKDEEVKPEAGEPAAEKLPPSKPELAEQAAAPVASSAPPSKSKESAAKPSANTLYSREKTAARVTDKKPGANEVVRREADTAEQQDLSVGTGVYKTYLKRISSLCKEAQAKEPEVALLLKKGKKILDAPLDLSPHQYKQVETIVSLLKQSADKDRESMCKALKEVLQEEEE